MRITFTSLLVVFATCNSSNVAAFAPSPTMTTRTTRKTWMTKTHRFLSDIPRETDEQDNNIDRQWFKPPPKPEDQFVMAGDLLSLCVYGISDHFFCQTVSKMMVAQTLADPTHHLSRAAAASTMASRGSDLFLQAPVWMDPNSPYMNQVLESNLSNQLVTHYSPALEPMGQATVLLVASWLLAGWFHQAFSFKNTLNCTTERAILVTVRTWLTTCALLFAISLSSQAACGCDHFYLVAKGDLDFVVDSSSVLIWWRFLASYLLGSGQDEN
eukprot:CAMPEP_0198141942 /NCGR_PEP_ID=MMETSP1443-20131203/4859_1 /TAXON_ID=186043 /ORGANISM="Entomoneis sp., Strain CCMP2396" /LENGTH=269 /DNA_ID=CAMNT_0043804835 /DNA_START=408 /DNA_END=1217 /DNA_ORIENTATION=+